MATQLPLIAIHAGFHKTGTSSVQQTLRENRSLLEQELRPLVKEDMPGMSEAARAYARDRSDLNATLFAHEVAVLFERLEPTDARPVLLSCEDLAGLIPGRERRRGYPAAPDLMKIMAETISEVWGEAPPMAFYFSTRAAEPWIRSCYAQHLRATRMDMDYADYLAWQLPHADLDAQVAAVATAMAGRTGTVIVTSCRLETVKDAPLGPFQRLARLLDLSEELKAQITCPAPVNAALPPEVQQALLDLNRSDKGDDEVHVAKQALIRAHRRGKTAS